MDVLTLGVLYITFIAIQAMFIALLVGVAIMVIVCMCICTHIHRKKKKQE